MVVTDAGATAAEIAVLEDQGIEVVVAG